MSKGKKVILVILSIVVLLGIVFFVVFRNIGKKTEEALAKQVNVDIDMNLVKDGTYNGSSEGGLVEVEVEVEVRDHTITAIKLVKHQNGMGSDAEAIIDQMVAKNTDDVDAVSGATVSSKTIRNAVNTALQKGLE